LLLWASITFPHQECHNYAIDANSLLGCQSIAQYQKIEKKLSLKPNSGKNSCENRETNSPFKELQQQSFRVLRFV
jgi:hypothetical protein